MPSTSTNAPLAISTKPMIRRIGNRPIGGGRGVKCLRISPMFRGAYLTVTTDRVPALEPLKDQCKIPGDNLPHSGQAHHGLRPPGVIARKTLHEYGVRAPSCPPQTTGHRHREQALAVLVLGLSAVPFQVSLSGVPAADAVPRRGLVPAPRREPRR